MPSFTLLQWTLAALAAYFSGLSKAGLAGVGVLGVTLMAAAVPGKASTGIVLPLLIFADLIAASTFRAHVQWNLLRRLAMPICLVPAVLAGLWSGKRLVDRVPQRAFQDIVLGLAAVSAVWLLAH